MILEHGTLEAVCRAPALCVVPRRSVSGPDTLCVGARCSLALCESGRGALCVGARRSLRRAAALCVGPRRSLCRAPPISRRLCRASAPYRSCRGRRSLALCRADALCVGPGGLCVGPQRCLCRGPALSVSGPSALYVRPRHPLALCVGICVRAQRSPAALCVGAAAVSVSGAWRSPSVSGPALCRRSLLCRAPALSVSGSGALRERRDRQSAGGADSSDPRAAVNLFTLPRICIADSQTPCRPPKASRVLRQGRGLRRRLGLQDRGERVAAAACGSRQS